MGKWGGTGDYDSQRSYVFQALTNGSLIFAIADAARQGDGAFQTFLTPAHVLPFNAWTHVAAVYDQSTGTRRIYVNGVNVASRTDAPITVLNSIANAGIGAYLLSSTTPTEFFNGLLDEVSFYSRALSGAEIGAIYNAGSAGKCSSVSPTITTQPVSQTVGTGASATFSVTASGSAPFSYQWRFGSNSLTGATNASLILTNAQAASAGNYSVVVSNAAGSATSSNAVLTVAAPPWPATRALCCP